METAPAQAQTELHVVSAGDLAAADLYAILRLRAEVFVVEQQCPYLDPDGRDIEQSTVHLWLSSAGVPVTALRLLREPDGAHQIGRVVTSADWRRRGLAETLIRQAMELAGPPIYIGAQSHLEQWYGRLGFVTAGPHFDWDGIDHVPMWWA